MIKISKRLHALADMVSEGAVLADVGTDHSYVPIYLLQTGKIKRAFAMDIGKGPLMRAREHVEACGLGDYITLRLSDGVAALSEGEADSVLIAGMGGGVILHILEEGKDVIASAKELILQPQSEIERVRKHLYDNSYIIDREDMVYEDGKYYPMMHIVLNGTKQGGAVRSDRELQMIYRYGEALLSGKHKTLCQYLLYRMEQYETILGRLKDRRTAAAEKRAEEIETELQYVKWALHENWEVRQSEFKGCHDDT